MLLLRRQFLASAAAAAALPLAARVADAQSYPERPIRLVVPFPPGGAFDAVARPWVDRMKPLLGTMVVENIGGGGSSLGAAAVARARPDGYTILLGGSLPHVNEALLKSRPLYDPLRDLDPVAGLAVVALSLAVHPSVPAHTLAEFVAYAKANAGKVSYGHAGVGSLNQLTGEMFKMLAGLPELVQVPYRGAGPTMADLISGQLAMAVVAFTGQSLEFHRSGKLRILAVTSPQRLIAAPELPTVAEAGFPGLTNLSTIGPVAPAGTPTAICEQIARAVRAVLAEPAYRQQLIESGFEASPDTTPEAFRQRLAADITFWTPVVEALALKIN
jgi:tripartite-type tricarboxylate transporter receptor subunit TctC